MSEAKHTKGPWKRVYGQGYGKGSITSKHFVGSSGELARCHIPAKYDRGQLSKEAFLEMEANASLIAAAPDLLDACKNFREWWADHFEDFDDHYNGELLCLDNDCEAAIAKATD